MSRLSLWKFNEASSGTTPTSVVDSDASPVNLAITYAGAAAWTSVSGYGNALRYPAAQTATRSSNTSISGSKYTTAFDGTRKTCTVACAVQINSGFSGTNYGTTGVGWQYAGGSDGTLLQAGFKTLAQTQFGVTATLDGTGGDYVILPALPAVGWHVFQGVIDTPNATANSRARMYVDGFLAADASTSGGGAIAQNAVLPLAAAIESGAFSWDPATYFLEGVDQGGAAIYDSAFTARDALSQALRWFGAGASDLDPDTAGASLVSATGPDGTSGGLGATTDGSTSTVDHTVAPTVTIAAAGANRAVFLAITAASVTAGVSGTPTLDGTNGAKVTGTLSGSNDVEWWWWNDAALPSSAGTYTFSATVDGVTGTLVGSAQYLEGVSQSIPTNFGSATGTGTSLTASMTSNPAAGSILLGVLFDATTTDAPTYGVNQLPLAKANGTSTGNTHVHVGTAKYVTASGADSMAWATLTNASAKIGVAIEVGVFTAGDGANSLFFGAGSSG